MTPVEFRKYLARDFGRCCHCGVADDTLIPQHRANRGMGSVKSRNRPSNIIVMCSWFNQQVEQNPKSAEMALKYGWKLHSYDDPTFAPVWDIVSQRWWVLDDNFNRSELLTV